MEPIRKYPRIKCDLTGEIILVTEGSLPRSAKLTQLGQGGALLIPSEPVEANQVFVLKLPLPNGETRLVCTVRYQFKFSDQSGEGVLVGVEFEDAEDAPQPLLDYLEEMLPEDAIFMPGK